MLTEPEAKAAISAYGIAVPETIVATTVAEVRAAGRASGKHGRHRRQAPVERDLAQVRRWRGGIEHRERRRGGRRRRVDRRACTPAGAGAGCPRLCGATDGRSQRGSGADSRHEPRSRFSGRSILFGAGGVAVEVMDDTAVALPPLDDVLARDLVAQTRIGRLLAGFRDRKPSDQAAITAALNGLSQMIVDFPCLVAIDINPLLADDTRRHCA